MGTLYPPEVLRPWDTDGPHTWTERDRDMPRPKGTGLGSTLLALMPGSLPVNHRASNLTFFFFFFLNIFIEV